MAGLFRHIAAALLFLLTAASTAGASTYYASDPNLGSARVVFQVLPHDLDSCSCFCSYRREIRTQVFRLELLQIERPILAFGGGKISRN